MISVVLTTFNGVKYIDKQIDSIMHQTLMPDEVLVFDDGSTDGSLEKLHQLANIYPQIKINVNKENLGYVMNFWNGIKKAKGEYIFLSDQDDVWLDDKVEKMVELFESTPSMLSLNTGYITIDENGDKIKNFKDMHYSNKGKLSRIKFEDFIKSPRYPGMAMAIKRDLISAINVNDEKVIHSHDWFLNLNASLRNGMFFCDCITSCYRQHRSNTYGTNANQPKENMKKRRLEVINDEECLNQIVLSLDTCKQYRDFIEGQKKAIFERKKALKSGNILKIIMCYIQHKKYLALRGFLGDIYVLF